MLHPLLLAVSLNAEDIVETLLRSGANSRSTFGNLEETCFHLYSRESGSIEIADLLLKYSQGSADERTRLLGKPWKDGRTPYHFVVYQGHFKLADWYAARGVNVEATLYIVTWNIQGMIEVLRLLYNMALISESKLSRATSTTNVGRLSTMRARAHGLFDSTTNTVVLHMSASDYLGLVTSIQDRAYHVSL
jgi:Ankyrin repeats (3 copies)